MLFRSGEAAVDEILENRPYKTIEELLWDSSGTWRHSKFNKRVLEGLIAIKAFDSLDCVGEDKTFKNYRQMHEVLITKNGDLKKFSKKNPAQGIENFKAALEEFKDIPDWTKQEMINNSIKYLGSFNMSAIVPVELLEKFEKKGVKSIDDIEANEVCWFIIVDAKPKLTKNKKPYLLINAAGLSGSTKRIFVWGWDGKTTFDPYTLCISEVMVDGFGCKTFINKIKVLES